MATRQQQARTLMVYEAIDAVLTANASGAQKELEAQGFEFPYGQNAMLTEKYMIQLYSNNEPLFWSIMRKVPINVAAISPASKTKLSTLVTSSGTNAKSDWWASVLSTLQGTQTSGGGEQTTTETTAGAYVGYVIVILAILGITFYMFKNIK